MYQRFSSFEATSLFFPFWSGDTRKKFSFLRGVLVFFPLQTPQMLPKDLPQAPPSP